MSKNPKSVKEYQAAYYTEVLKDRRRKVPKREGACAYCGAHGVIGDDHIVATRDGGSDEAQNKRNCCTPCNRSKGPRPLEIWRETIGRWHAGIPYFSPEQSSYLLRNGFDPTAPVKSAAAAVTFAFEGGDGNIVRSFVKRRLTDRA